jgi:hypothetical protein
MSLPSIAFLELSERIARDAADFCLRRRFAPSHVIVGPKERAILRGEHGNPNMFLQSSLKDDTLLGLIIEEGNEPGFEVGRKNGTDADLEFYERLATPDPVAIHFTEHVHTCPRCKRAFKFVIHENGYIEQIDRCTCGAPMPREFIK